jgi:demethylmenaquinone methyltransferase/2-methoxy-6-polyprenyl-1,4-benzoquinol methylase
MPDRDAVRSMFSAIAPRYDFLNHLLSAGIDRAWRRRAVEAAGNVRGALVLDVCCGTGDLALEFANAGARVVGSDFAAPMLAIANKKVARAGARIAFLAGDALSLPFRDETFDVVSVAFGIRNVENLAAGLAELRRVLRNGGKAIILEFTTPPNRAVRGAFGFYFHRVLPRIGNALAGVRTDAYQYLPDSVAAFPDAPHLARALEESGFARVEFRYTTGGIAAIHAGTR